MLRKLCSCSLVVLFGVSCSGQLGLDSGSSGDDNSGSEETGPGDPGSNPLPYSACKRVDLVFSVDDSGSMQEEMDAMRGDVFPGFANALLDIGDGLDDYRVGVIDACPQPAAFNTRGDGGDCNFEGGKVWMDSSSTSLVDEFSCVGDIYSGDAGCTGDNDDEQPASAIADALGTSMVNGGPNDGFLRDDALLVVVAITDEDEQPTPDASAQEVYNQLVAIKGDVNKMVFLGIGGQSNCSGVYGSADEATRLKEVTDLFAAQDQGLFWDLCDGRLEDGLAAAMGVIESACDDFCTNVTDCEGGGGGGGGDGSGGGDGGGSGGGDGSGGGGQPPVE